MSRERLLQYFETISETDDTVPRLRQFVLELAIRGKLVEQSAEDEPASNLLEQIQKEKARLEGLGILRNQALQPLDMNQLPFAIPANWRWTQLAEVGAVNPRIEAKDFTKASFVPMPMIFAEYGKPNRHEVRLWRDIKRGFTQFAEGDVGLAKITPCFENGKSTVFRSLEGGIGAGTTELHIVRPILVLADFILIFLKSPHFIETGIQKMTGSAGQKRVPKAYFAFSAFPLPPLAEQHRIVAKVDELMALCDELEAARTRRETRRDHLVAATLHRLNNGNASPEAGNDTDFKPTVRFYFSHLPRLTTRPEHIKQLRQAVLNLAVHGKLVSQNSNDESAEELLNRIKLVKATIDTGQNIRAKKRSLESSDRGNTISLPTGWALPTLGELVRVLNGRAYAKNELLNSGMPVLRVGNLFTSNRWYYSNLKLEKDKYCDKGDLLFAWSASFGPFIWSGPEVIYHYHIWKLNLYSEPNLNKNYLYWFLRHKTQEIKESGHGVAMVHMTKEKMEKVVVPLPPLAEQHRIVEKVNELMALCDELEVQLTTTSTTRRQLLEATLHDALDQQKMIS